MQTLASKTTTNKPELAKAPTGIHGLDEITFGGLPAGRPTLICGSAGCGKTLFGMTFLINGIISYDEPGVIMTFEEKSEDLAKNVQSLGYDINELIAQNKLMIPVLACDFTVIRTAARTNPTLYTLKKGTIQKKYSYHNFDQAANEIKKL